MKAYITGTSSGIGKAITEKLLNEGHEVVGLSRTKTIQHQNYKHIFIDFKNLDAVSAFEFETDISSDICLINNAGIIEPIRPVGHLLDQEIIQLTQINLVVPQLLINKFLHKYQTFNNKYHIINISSGAGKYPIDAWAGYCASKAGLDLFSETINLEWENRQIENWAIHSFAPGVVDTQMQTKIRASNPNDFKNLQKFLDLKTNQELLNPELVAEKIFDILAHPKQYNQVVFSIRDLT
ncbi:MAG: SDR family NAD(P)-dependent oxidoreductase [Putridiphycobacter sp.]